MSIKKVFWFSLGVLLLGIAYIGIFLPGLPWSTPTVGAAYCFAKSSDRMHDWLYNHKLFGPFLTNWKEKKIFPTKLKYVMILTMTSSVVILWFTTANPIAVLSSAIAMVLVAIWAWKYPGSEEEYQRRVREGKKIAWIK